jgi:excisionase family DNA binding protein
MTVREVAVKLSVHHSTVYSLIGTGQLACHRLGVRGGKISVDEKHIDDYLRSCERGGKGGQKLTI